MAIVAVFLVSLRSERVWFFANSLVSHFTLGFFVPVTLGSLFGSTITALESMEDPYVAVGLTSDIAVFERVNRSLRFRVRQQTRGVVHHLIYRKGTLYAATGMQGLTYYSWRSPNDFRSRGDYCLPGYCLGLALSGGNQILVASSNGGVSCFGISSRGRPLFRHQVFGSRSSPDDGMVGDFATNKVTSIGRWVVASDALHGFIVADTSLQQGATVRYFKPQGFSPLNIEYKDMEHAPWSVQTFDPFIYAAMFEEGFAVLVLEGEGHLRLLGLIKPDDGAVRDLETQANRLLVSTDAGNIFQYDLGVDPTCTGPPRFIYHTGQFAKLKTLKADPNGFLAASATTIYGFENQRPEPILQVRMDDEVRGLARVNRWMVVALGPGGVGIYDTTSQPWREVQRSEFEGYIAAIEPLGGDQFIAVALWGGPFVVKLEKDGSMSRGPDLGTNGLFTLSASASESEMVVSGGISGYLSYRRRSDGEIITPPTVFSIPNVGYISQVALWAGHVWVADVMGALLIKGDAKQWPEEIPAPNRCISMSPSSDGTEFTINCAGGRVYRFRAEPSGLDFRSAEPLKVSREPYSSILTASRLIVGEYPNSVAIYQVDGDSLRLLQRFEIKGIPYRIVSDGLSIFIAAGRGGIYELTEDNEVWTLRQVLITTDDVVAMNPAKE